MRFGKSSAAPQNHPGLLALLITLLPCATCESLSIADSDSQAIDKQLALPSFVYYRDDGGGTGGLPVEVTGSVGADGTETGADSGAAAGAYG